VTSERPAGVRIIVAYKWMKVVLELAIAAMLFFGARRGLAAHLTALATELRAHAVHAWSDAAVSALLRFLERPHDLLLVAGALTADALVALVEGWVLFRGYTWGPWVVVGATGSTIPFEILALAHRFSVARFAFFSVNVAIVAYLVRRVVSRRARMRGKTAAAVAAIALVTAVGAEAGIAACRTAANGAHSFDTRLSPVAGRVCRMTVDVFAGATCGQPPRWHVMLPCDQTQRMAISNQGRLISILMPATKRQDLNAVRVTWSAEKYAWATLAKLTAPKPLRGEVRLDFDGDALRLKADRTVTIPFEDVRRLASAMAD
jgi:uncharacterized membrane protein (DUF2068 family)